MEQFYTYCAIIAGSLMVVQFLLALTGLSQDVDLHDMDGIHDHDISGDAGDHGGAWFVGMLSFRAIVSAVTVFGLVGLGASRQFERWHAFIIAIIAGSVVMYLVGWVMQSLHHLRADGTVNIERAIGLGGSVYLAIPGKNEGVGKVTVDVQDRTMEYRAVTSGEPLPSGTPIVVLQVVSPETVEVAKANETSLEGNAHVQS